MLYSFDICMDWAVQKKSDKIIVGASEAEIWLMSFVDRQIDMTTNTAT